MNAVLKPEYLWVDPEHAEYALAEALPLIMPSLEYGDGKYDEIDLLEKLKDNTAVLWLARYGGRIEAAGITWIDIYPQEKRMTLAFAGGDKALLEGLHGYVEDYAKQVGCLAIEVWGRKGWIRELAPLGYEYIHTVVRKKL